MELTYPITSFKTVLDHCWEWFVVQAKPKSTRPSEYYRLKVLCGYRSEHSACAIGCCLPDEVAAEWDGFENAAIRNIAEARDTEGFHRIFNGLPVDDLEILQKLHDEWSSAQGDFNAYIRNGLLQLYRTHGFTPPADAAQPTESV